MVANGLTGAALVIAGVGRLAMFYSNYSERASRRKCMLMPWNILFSWAEPMQAVSLFMVSLDRLIALSFPLAYFKKNGFIEITECILPICFWTGSVTLLVMVSWYFSWQDTKPIFDPFCWTPDSQLPFFRQFFLLVVITASIGSVLLYIAVYAMTRESVRRARNTQMGSKAADAFERRQRKLTRTMNISCVVTMIFYVTPMCVRFFIGGTIGTTVNDFVTVYSGISCNFNPLAILAALFIMQEDVKGAVLSSLPHCLHRLIPSAVPN
ncbi:unnamed protein product [Gongylonema pulchrum]|uniref:G_PROTEIN_RECEP_F1_2 domain-containing protein n=1 Tax=Gongylonema pulchrum TaxID=637853 RepID=A0A183DZ50_9BILA|nr:unnamed protein product [Gongylonema pulchrum]